MAEATSRRTGELSRQIVQFDISNLTKIFNTHSRTRTFAKAENIVFFLTFRLQIESR